MVSSFDLLSDDIIHQIISFVGIRSYAITGLISKRCNILLNNMKLPKLTSYRLITVNSAEELYEKLLNEKEMQTLTKLRKGIAKGVVNDRNINLLHWALQKQDNDLFFNIAYIAAKSGNFELLKYVFQKPTTHEFDSKYCKAASSGGHMEILKWLRSNGCPWCKKTCKAAAKHGHLEILKYARMNGCPWDKKTCKAAALSGHAEVLRWAREQGCPCDENTCYSAAREGHFEALIVARQLGCPWNKKTCEYAALGGHLEILKYARENGCPWDAWTCQYAAGGGQLGVLQWARRNGCPWNEATCHAASEGGHLEVLIWCRQNGCPWDEKQCYLNALSEGKTNITSWMRKNGCPDYTLADLSDIEMDEFDY